jgi:hypothetical protein
MLNNLNISSSQTQLLQLLKSQLANATLPAGPAPVAGNSQQNTPLATLSANQVLNALSMTGTNQAKLSQKAIEILKRPPFEPTNINLFTPQTYAEATPMQPAAAKPVNEAQIRGQLISTLASRLRNCKDIQAGMELYNDPAITSVVSDPRLRAALISLKGTAGEAAIDSIKNGTFKDIRFEDLPGDIIAVSQLDNANEPKPSIVFNNRYQHEDFRLLAPTLLHETMHTDIPNSLREERINATLDTMVYGQMALENPRLTQSGTELSRRFNTRLMGIVNSRNSDGQLRPYTAQAGNVFPGGRTLNNYGDAFRAPNGQPISDSSPGNETFRKVLKAVTGVNLPDANFDAAADNAIDQNQILFSPNNLVQLAKILKLNTGK